MITNCSNGGYMDASLWNASDTNTFLGYANQLVVATDVWTISKFRWDPTKAPIIKHGTFFLTSIANATKSSGIKYEKTISLSFGKKIYNINWNNNGDQTTSPYFHNFTLKYGNTDREIPHFSMHFLQMSNGSWLSTKNVNVDYWMTFIGNVMQT